MMKKMITVLGLAALAACADDVEGVVSPPTEFQLVWSDEFDGEPGDPVDLRRWSYDIGTGPSSAPGWGNNELQFYTDRAGTDGNVYLDGQGRLAITARRESFGGVNYTSGRLRTRSYVRDEGFAAERGRIEARIRMPEGEGLWSAFWLLGNDLDPETTFGSDQSWPWVGEIDIVEFIGQDPFRVFGTVHGPGYSGIDNNFITNDYRLYEEQGFEGFDQGFHVYAIDWDPTKITWLVDGIAYATIRADQVVTRRLGRISDEWVFNNPFFLILNVAVGGNLGGSVIDQDADSWTMLVDYVRVYSRP